MTYRLPIHLFKGLSRLTPKTIEEKLIEHAEEFLIAREFNSSARERGLFFDLSQIRWVNLGAVTQLVLLIEYAKKNGIQVFIALPLKRLTRHESESKSYSDEVKEDIRSKREDANSFLKLIQFDRAVKCEHIPVGPEIEITQDFEFSQKDSFAAEDFNRAFGNAYVVQDAKPDYAKYNYRYILPLTWINVKEDGGFTEGLEKKFEEVLADEQRGLQRSDILAIKNVIISELIKNVKEHAGEGTDFALFSIGLMPTKTLVRRGLEKSEYNANDLEKDYFDWLLKNEIKNFIEIYFGDTGTGLLSGDLERAYDERREHKKPRLGSKNKQLAILQWAFEKWSTKKLNEEIRGTKGLYRINRIVNKYNGIFLIRSNHLHGGYQRGGYSFAKWIDNGTSKYSNYPGTFIQLKLCPDRELTKFVYSFDRNESKRTWHFIHCLLTERNMQEIDRFVLQNGLIRSNNILLILQFEKNITLDRKRDFLEEALRKLSYLSHPNGIVVYVTDEWDGGTEKLKRNDMGAALIGEIVDSTNELICKEFKDGAFPEAFDPNHETVYDPILILTGGDNIFWFGEDQKIIKILNELYNASNVTDIRKLQAFLDLSNSEKDDVMRHFRNDNSLVTIRPDFSIEFNFTNLTSFITETIIRLIDKEGEGENICTPKLEVIGRWHEVKSILTKDAVAGYALAMYMKVKEELKAYEFSKRTHVLIDHTQQYDLATEFAKIAGLDERNIVNIMDSIDHTIPRRTTLFSREDDVIILTTFISSSETIRRLIKYIMRDLAHPICIICLVNSRRRNIDSIETWGERTPIFGLYQRYANNKEDTDKKDGREGVREYAAKLEELSNCSRFISPEYEKEEDLLEEEVGKAAVLPIELKEHIVNTRSLHYNHIGSYAGRHFTFYINKRKILEEGAFIWKVFERSIDRWLESRKTKSFVLVKPVFNKDTNSALDSCIKYLKDKYTITDIISWNIDKPKPIEGKWKEKSKREDEIERNIIYIDFGSLTGNSLNTFLSYVEGVDNIFITILFSQFEHNEMNLYRRIKTIEVDRNEDENDQLSMFRRTKESTATVKIEFLFDLPFSYYNSTSCPICEHERALDLYRLQDEFMLEYVNDRKKRIKIRDKRTINEFPVDFYAGKEDRDFELSSILIMKMYELKQLLAKAIYSTQQRVLVYRYVFYLYKNMQFNLQEANSEMYAFLYFISNEVNWLQRDPLVFRDLRNMIAEVSLYVAGINVRFLAGSFRPLTKSDEQAFNLAVRFKYAAITVLRAAHKHKFCKNIQTLLTSAVFNGMVSNNLLQNIFYHINSLHQNHYNKSTEYFQELEDQFKYITEENTGLLSASQKASFFILKVNNLRIKRRLEWNNSKPASPLEAIKGLKSEFKQLYSGESHPIVYELFQELDFSLFDEGFYPSIKAEGTKSDYFPLLKGFSQEFENRWGQVFSALDPLQIYFEKLPSKIFESDFFRINLIYDRISRIFGTQDSRGLLQEFSHYSRLINKSPLNLIGIYHDYKKAYQQIYEGVITYRKPGTIESKNSILMNLVENFPANIEDRIKDVFGHAMLGNKINLNIPGNCKYVFYPISTLDFYLNHIIGNLKERCLNKDNLKDIVINIDANYEETEDQRFISVLIRYDGTSSVKRGGDNIRKSGGGLKQFEDDLKIFGGSLHYDQCPQTENFIIRLKFIPYE